MFIFVERDCGLLICVSTVGAGRSDPGVRHRIFHPTRKNRDSVGLHEVKRKKLVCQYPQKIK